MKMSSFTKTRNRHKQISTLWDNLIVTNLSLSCLKCSTMEPWLKHKFPKHSEIKIRTLQSVFSVWKCHLSPRQGIVISKLVHFEITLIVTKLSLSCLKCCTMDAWVKLMFQKAFEIRIWTFLSVFSASKCRLSLRLGSLKAN